MTIPPLTVDCIREVVELHAFFQAWLRGELPDHDHVFARFLGATAPEFALISPDGQTAGLAETADWIRRAHGARPGVLLWTDEHAAPFADDEAALITYREGQTRDSMTTLRICSALFRRKPDAPNRVVWLHVHETWIQK